MPRSILNPNAALRDFPSVWAGRTKSVVSLRIGIRTQNFDEIAVLAQQSQSILNLAVLNVAIKVDKEEVLPGFALAGTRLDLSHVDAVASESGQGAVQRSDFVSDADHNARAVAAGRWGGL